MAKLQFAFWDGVGGYAEQDANMADVYDEHIRMAQRLEELAGIRTSSLSIKTHRWGREYRILTVPDSCEELPARFASAP